MKTRTLLIDASYLLKRSFHGAKDTYTSSGIHVGAIYQFLTTTRMLISKHSINQVITFWDGQQCGRDRYLLDSNYKANRKSKDWHNRIELSDAEIKREKEKEESLLYQKVKIKNYLENLFIKELECEFIESDDLIAAYCLKHHNDESISIYTNDRDFAQLLDLNITIIFGNIAEPITKNNYMMHFDHHYSNALTLKIICGDAGDNVKGIEGIQESTLLKHFPELKYKHLSVREICQKADEINKTRIANKQKPLKCLESLIHGVPRLRLNFKLVNLREPMLNEEAEEALDQLEMPLNPDDRGSKNLMKLMNEDEFLTIYGSTFVQYVEPFYTVIMHEKNLFEEYKKNIRKDYLNIMNKAKLND